MAIFKLCIGIIILGLCWKAWDSYLKDRKMYNDFAEAVDKQDKLKAAKKTASKKKEVLKQYKDVQKETNSIDEETYESI